MRWLRPKGASVSGLFKDALAPAIIGLSTCCGAPYAKVDCQSTESMRPDELHCEDLKGRQQIRQANALYSWLYKTIPDEQSRRNLVADYPAWLGKLDKECELRREAFNAWGKDDVPDSDFQYPGCRTSIAGDQVKLYEQLICPDTLETDDKPDCLEHFLFNPLHLSGASLCPDFTHKVQASKDYSKML